MSLLFCFQFHERSVDADLCLALCREAQAALRPDLRLLVMSATLGGELAPSVASLLGDCRILTAEGRSFPVEVRYAPNRPLPLVASGPPWELEAEVADAIVRAMMSVAAGDVLVFLPGEREIRGVESELAQRAGFSAEVLPLYAALPLAQQSAAVRGRSDEGGGGGGGGGEGCRGGGCEGC